MAEQQSVVRDRRHAVRLSTSNLAAVAQAAHEWYAEMGGAVAARVIWQLGRAEPDLRVSGVEARLSMIVLLTLAEATALMHACSWAMAELTASDRMEPHDLDHRQLLAEGLGELAMVRA